MLESCVDVSKSNVLVMRGVYKQTKEWSSRELHDHPNEALNFFVRLFKFSNVVVAVLPK